MNQHIIEAIDLFKIKSSNRHLFSGAFSGAAT